MTSEQYEELCRLFLSEKFGIPAAKITSPVVPNPRRPELPEYRHQIDLLWETDNELATYLHIANAKWRSHDKVDQPEVLLLQQVKYKVAAHKALMITNTGYTAGAKAVALDERIALHVLTPSPTLEQSLSSDREQIRERLRSLAASSATALYSHKTETRAFDDVQMSSPAPRLASSKPSLSDPRYETRVVTSSVTRAMGEQPALTQSGQKAAHVTRSLGPGGKK